MRSKTMTIPEFMQAYRIKEFNKKNRRKQLYFILLFLILLATAQYLDSNETTTAFQQLNNLALF